MIQRLKPFSQQDDKRKKIFQAGFKTQEFHSNATENAPPKRRTASLSSARGCGIQIAQVSQKLKLFLRFREKIKVTGYWF
jgi:hypothetical protein